MGEVLDARYFECPDCTRELSKEEFDIIEKIGDADCYCWLIEEVVSLKKNKTLALHLLNLILSDVKFDYSSYGDLSEHTRNDLIKRLNKIKRVVKKS